jgi:secreted trypsin-like serine protease
LLKVKFNFFLLGIICFTYLSSSDSISRIIGGSSISQEEFKHNNFVVAIGHKKEFKKNRTKKEVFVPFCTGTLLSSTWVLTAGHCLNDEQMYIYSNTNKLFNVKKLSEKKEVKNNKNSILVKVRRIFYPYDFELLRAYGKLWTVHNDIALLQLQEPIKLDIYPSLVNKKMLQKIISLNKKAHLIGWGRIEKNKLPTVLKHTFVSVINHKTCRKSYLSQSRSIDADIIINPDMLDTFSENIICGGGYELEGVLRGSCSGDSGAGLIYDDSNKSYIIGVLSSGTEPCGDLPDKYTNVTQYINFIQDTIKYKGSKTKIRKSILRKGYIDDLPEGFHMVGTQKQIDYKSDLFESVKFLWVSKNNMLVKITLENGHLPKDIVINAKSGFWVKK